MLPGAVGHLPDGGLGAAEDGGFGTDDPNAIDDNCNGMVDEGTTGYDDDGSQEDDVQWAMRVLYAGIPALIGVVAVPLIRFGYPITRASHAKIREQLDARRPVAEAELSPIGGHRQGGGSSEEDGEEGGIVNGHAR